MNLYRISIKSKIPIKDLRKLIALGVLSVSEEPEFIDALIFHMRGNASLTVSQLLALIEDPDLLEELEAVKPRYASRAREQIAALGDLSQHLAPREVTAAIPGAARGDDDEGLIIAEWIKRVVPAEPVTHAWISVRLLAPLNEFMRGQIAPLISPALLNVRKLPELAGWWHSEKVGTRSTIKYFQKSLDL